MLFSSLFIYFLSACIRNCLRGHGRKTMPDGSWFARPPCELQHPLEKHQFKSILCISGFMFHPLWFWFARKAPSRKASLKAKNSTLNPDEGMLHSVTLQVKAPSTSQTPWNLRDCGTSRLLWGPCLKPHCKDEMGYRLSDFVLLL